MPSLQIQRKAGLIGIRQEKKNENREPFSFDAETQN